MFETLTGRRIPNRNRKTALFCATALISLAAAPAFAQATIDSGATETVNGAGGGTQASPWNVGGALIVGDTANGGATSGTLEISSGGSVTNTAATLGASAGSIGRVDINSSGGNSWTSTGLLTIGDLGDGEVLHRGGNITTDNTILGSGATGIGSVTMSDIAGNGARWTNNGTMIIGDAGEGVFRMEEFSILNANRGLTIGNAAGSNGALLVETGSAFNANNFDIIVGNEGQGVFAIRSGGKANNNRTVISSERAGSESIILVTDANSEFNGNNFRIGRTGTGALEVRNGGAVTATGQFLMADNASGDATVTVDGAGSVIRSSGVGSVSIGVNGAAELNITNGGAFAKAGTGGSFTVAGSSLSTASITIDGANSTLTSNRDVTLGSSGNAALAVTAGGVFELSSSTGTLIAADNAGSVADIMVDGAGSQLNAVDITLARFGRGDLAVTNGGVVAASGDIQVGDESGSTGAVVVDGANAVLSTGGALFLGDSGTASLDIRNGGAVEVTNDILMAVTGGAATIDVDGAGSRLEFGQSFTVGQQGASTVDITNGAVVSATGVSSMTIGAFGTGAVTVDGAGSMLDAGRGMTVSDAASGSLIITSGAAARAERAEIGLSAASSGSVVIDGANSLFEVYSGPLVLAEFGQGEVTVRNGGVLDASGVAATGNDFVIGLSAGSFGVLNIGAAEGQTAQGAGAVDAGTIKLGDGRAEIVFNHTDTDYVFTADIISNRTASQPFDSFHDVSIRSGVTRMTGAWSHERGVDVFGGHLIVDGTIENGVFVSNGASLSGSGSLQNDLYTVGVLSPGNSIGTLTIDRNLTLDEQSVLEIEVNDAGASDLVDVGGEVRIFDNVTLEVLPENGTDDGSTYNESTAYTFIRAAGGITGEFATVTESFAFLDAEVTIENGEAVLTLVRAANPDNGGGVIEFEDVAVSPNQRSIARSLEALGAGSELYDVVVGLSEAQARTAFDQLSGEVHASALASVMQDSRIIRDVATDRLRAASDEDGLSIWGSAYGSWGTWDESGDNTAAELDRSTAGFVFGADFPLFSAFRLGALLGVAGGDVEIDARGSEADIGTFHFGAYADWDVFKAMTIRAGLLNSWNDLETERAVDIRGFNSFSDRLTAEYNANVFQFFAEAAYAFDLGRFNVEPYAGLAYASLDVDDVTERGGSARLTAAEYDMKTTFSTLGMRADYAFEMFGANAALEGGLAWRHAFDDTLPRQTFRFANAGAADGRTFTTEGVPLAEDAAIIDLGLSLPLAKRIGAGLGYNGQFGNGVSDHGIRANLSFSF